MFESSSEGKEDHDAQEDNNDIRMLDTYPINNNNSLLLIVKDDDIIKDDKMNEKRENIKMIAYEIVNPISLTNQQNYRRS